MPLLQSLWEEETQHGEADTADEENQLDEHDENDENDDESAISVHQPLSLCHEPTMAIMQYHHDSHSSMSGNTTLPWGMTTASPRLPSPSSVSALPLTVNDVGDDGGRRRTLSPSLFHLPSSPTSSAALLKRYIPPLSPLQQQPQHPQLCSPSSFPCILPPSSCHTGGSSSGGSNHRPDSEADGRRLALGTLARQLELPLYRGPQDDSNNNNNNNDNHHNHWQRPRYLPCTTLPNHHHHHRPHGDDPKQPRSRPIPVSLWMSNLVVWMCLTWAVLDTVRQHVVVKRHLLDSLHRIYHLHQVARDGLVSAERDYMVWQRDWNHLHQVGHERRLQLQQEHQQRRLFVSENNDNSRQEEALHRERVRLASLQQSVQQWSRWQVEQNFGNEDAHVVELRVEFLSGEEEEEEEGNVLPLQVEMASLNDMPHSVHTFLQGVRQGRWNDATFVLRKATSQQAEGESSVLEAMYSPSSKDPSSSRLESPYFVEHAVVSPKQTEPTFRLGFVSAASDNDGTFGFYVQDSTSLSARAAEAMTISSSFSSSSPFGTVVADQKQVMDRLWQSTKSDQQETKTTLRIVQARVISSSSSSSYS